MAYDIVTDSSANLTEEMYDEFGITVHPIVTVAEIREHIEGKMDRELLDRMDAYIAEHCNI
jgi:fatty acid-binding protein DegV